MKTFQEFLDEGKKKRKKEYNNEYEKVKKEVKDQKGNTIIDYGGDNLNPGSPALQARLDFMEKQRIKGLEQMKKQFKERQNDNNGNPS